MKSTLQQIYFYPEDNINIVKLSTIIKAGRIHESKKLQSLCAAKLIGKGSKLKTAEEINQLFDFYGGSFEIDAGFDDVKFTLTCLKKHFILLSSLFFEVIFEAVFNKDEFQLFINTRKEKLKQVLSKNDYLADRYTGRILFGENHPYGYAAEIIDYDQILPADLEVFYKKHYTPSNAIFIIAGDFDQPMTAAVEALLKNCLYNPVNDIEQIKAIQGATKTNVFKAPNPMQASLKISWWSIAPNHPDYPQYFVLNMILGGYFGSRLMQSIREEKGYTYGIYSQIYFMLFHTYTSISTEINRDCIEDTLHEIRACFDALRNEKITLEELNLVKNYIKGDLLRETDGSFRKSEAASRLWPYGLDESFYLNLLSKVEAITPEIICNTAKQYLNFDLCYQVIV